MNKQETAKFDFSEKINRIYLASPYTHENKEVMVFRYKATLKSAAKLLSKGYLAFSPIVHCHPIALAYTLPRDYSFWKDYSTSFLLCWAEAVVILCLKDWANSKGVQAEIMIARKAGLPVYYL